MMQFTRTTILSLLVVFCLTLTINATSEIQQVQDESSVEIPEETEKAPRVIMFEEEIRNAFTALSELLKTGTETIPSFDPLNIGDLSIHSENELLFGDLHLRNVKLSGIPYYELLEGYVNTVVLPPKGTLVLQLNFPELRLTCDYESELKIFGTVAFPSEGTLSVALSGTDISSTGTVSLSIIPLQIKKITEATMGLVLPSFLMEMTGFLNDDCLSEMIANPLSTLVDELLKQQEPAINQSINSLILQLVEIINNDWLPFPPPSSVKATNEEMIEELITILTPTIKEHVQKDLNKALEKMRINIIQN